MGFGSDALTQGGKGIKKGWKQTHMQESGAVWAVCTLMELHQCPHNSWKPRTCTSLHTAAGNPEHLLCAVQGEELASLHSS